MGIVSIKNLEFSLLSGFLRNQIEHMQTRFNRVEIFILVDGKSKISIDLFPAFSSAAEEILIGFGANLFIVSHIDANPQAWIN